MTTEYAYFAPVQTALLRKHGIVLTLEQYFAMLNQILHRKAKFHSKESGGNIALKVYVRCSYTGERTEVIVLYNARKRAIVGVFDSSTARERTDPMFAKYQKPERAVFKNIFIKHAKRILGVDVTDEEYYDMRNQIRGGKFKFVGKINKYNNVHRVQLRGKDILVIFNTKRRKLLGVYNRGKHNLSYIAWSKRK